LRRPFERATHEQKPHKIGLAIGFEFVAMMPARIGHPMPQQRQITAEPTIAYIPADNFTNTYTIRMRELLSAFGHLETFYFKARLLRFLKGDFRRIDIAFVNWLENELIDINTGRVSWRGTIKLLIKTLLLKLAARQIVFVRHNLYPHAASNESARAARWIVDRYESLFDLVFIHSGADITAVENNRHRYYLPHPLYSLAIDVARQVRPLNSPERYFLVFGRIVPYKRIESLIEHFPADQTLMVYGAVEDAGYAAKLAHIHRPNVIFSPGYIPEDVAQTLVAGAQAVVISHAESNAMVSGTFFYALSLQCRVFAVRTPFLQWVSTRLPADALVLGEDIPHLCRLISEGQDTRMSATTRYLIETEFGDAAVQSALSIAFKPH
jgi:glycosyltransferase involved in cell wall biosynthesis